MIQYGNIKKKFLQKNVFIKPAEKVICMTIFFMYIAQYF